MSRVVSRAVLGTLILAVAAAGVLTVSSGCTDKENKRASTTRPITRYENRGLRKTPDYLAGTIYERADMQPMRPYLVNGFGLVSQLRGTGDNSAIPTAVRDYMRKELLRHKFSTVENPTSPETVLRDPSVAVVRVDGLIPPGARADDRFDILVSVPEESYTSSLSHGFLARTSLKRNGADPRRPEGAVNAYAFAQGPVFVNPQYALLSQKEMDAHARQSVRYGVVMDGGLNLYDMPLTLLVRVPQFSTAGAIQDRINQRFQNIADKNNQKMQPAMAAAQDEGVVHVFVPRLYRGDYEHFAGVVKHLYMNGNPAHLAMMAEKLAAAAEQPDAPLENISYALEGIGQPAQGVLERMMRSPKPEIAFAAARAAVFIGEDIDEARTVLANMAKTPDHPFRLSAVRTLGDLPKSPETNSYLRQLLNVDNTPVRIAAYRALVRNNDPRVASEVIQEKFVLDMVDSSGAPMIYATRRGIPRIAVMGLNQSLATPLTFATVGSRLTITADETGGPITLYYRSERQLGDRASMAIRQNSRADIVDIIARLGGKAAGDEAPLDFAYADIVAIVQSLHQSGKLVATTADGKTIPVGLVIEEETGVTADQVMNAPQIPDIAREQDDREDVSAPPIPDSEAPARKPAEEKNRSAAPAPGRGN